MHHHARLWLANIETNQMKEFEMARLLQFWFEECTGVFMSHEYDSLVSNIVR